MVSRRKSQTQTIRNRVLAVVNTHDGFLTGQQIAQEAGLTYYQTIFALNALNNLAKVARIGRKFTAKWCRVTIQTLDEHPGAELDRAFRRFFA